jgi:hypothetical protein
LVNGLAKSSLSDYNAQPYHKLNQGKNETEEQREESINYWIKLE